MGQLKTYLGTVVILMALVLIPATTEAATPTRAELQTRLQVLLVELQKLQTQLQTMRAGQGLPPQQPGGQQCFPSGRGTLLCYTYGPGPTTGPSIPTPSCGTSKLDAIEVDLGNNSAEIRIEYKNGSDDEFILGGVDTKNDVIDFLVEETGACRTHVNAVLSWDGNFDDNDEDIESIDVSIDEDDNDAEVRVEYEDGDVERFHYNTDDEGDIIEELADDLDMDEEDVEDLVDFDNDNSNNDDIDSIEVTIDEDDEDATARVEYENGRIRTYSYNTDDEDEIIEELSDDLDFDEDDVEDLADFEYEDNNSSDEDVESIDVTIDEDDNDAEARVEYEDGDESVFYYDTNDEDEIIEGLADNLDMDEDDVEDLVDFDYVN